MSSTGEAQRAQNQTKGEARGSLATSFYVVCKAKPCQKKQHYHRLPGKPKEGAERRHAEKVKLCKPVKEATLCSLPYADCAAAWEEHYHRMNEKSGGGKKGKGKADGDSCEDVYIRTEPESKIVVQDIEDIGRPAVLDADIQDLSVDDAPEGDQEAFDEPEVQYQDIYDSVEDVFEAHFGDEATWERVSEVGVQGPQPDDAATETVSAITEVLLEGTDDANNYVPANAEGVTVHNGSTDESVLETEGTWTTVRGRKNKSPVRITVNVVNNVVTHNHFEVLGSDDDDSDYGSYDPSRDTDASGSDSGSESGLPRLMHDDEDSDADDDNIDVIANSEGCISDTTSVSVKEAPGGPPPPPKGGGQLGLIGDPYLEVETIIFYNEPQLEALRVYTDLRREFARVMEGVISWLTVARKWDRLPTDPEHCFQRVVDLTRNRHKQRYAILRMLGLQDYTVTRTSTTDFQRTLFTHHRPTVIYWALAEYVMHDLFSANTHNAEGTSYGYIANRVLEVIRVVVTRDGLDHLRLEHIDTTLNTALWCCNQLMIRQSILLSQGTILRRGVQGMAAYGSRHPREAKIFDALDFH